MAERVFKTTKKHRKPIRFTLDDREFEFKPPKMALAVLPAVLGDTSEMKSALDWLGRGLGEEDNTYLIQRLLDEDDEFDFDDLGPIIEVLIEEMGANPTS